MVMRVANYMSFRVEACEICQNTWCGAEPLRLRLHTDCVYLWGLHHISVNSMMHALHLRLHLHLPILPIYTKVKT